MRKSELLIFLRKRYVWEAADRTCRKGGMALLSLETYEEDLMINNHIKGTPGELRQ